MTISPIKRAVSPAISLSSAKNGKKVLDFNKIIFIGDIHGDFRPLYKAADQNKGASIIQVGDVGIGFSPNESQEVEQLKKLNRCMVENKCSLYLLRGNHDNDSYFTYKDPDLSNIRMIRDHSILTIGGKKIFFLGGGISIDRKVRIEGESWWPGERITPSITPLIDSVDIICTHAGLAEKYISNSLHSIEAWIRRDPALIDDLKQEESILLEIEKNIQTPLWICGHYHVHRVVQTDKTKFVFLDINEVYKLD